MSEPYRASPGVYGPREIEAMVGAYRGLLLECCDGGSLAAVARSTLSARELRRIAAKQVVVLAAIGVRDPQDLLDQAMERLAAITPATS